MSLKALGETAQFINGAAFKPTDWANDGLPIIRIQNLTGSGEKFNYTTRQVKPELIVEPGDLLVSWSATLDVYRWAGPRGVLNQHIFKVLPKPGIDPDYLFFALKTALSELMAKTHGSTMKHVVRGDFESTRVTVPPLPEQRRIVDLLSRAEGFVRLRCEAEKKAAELTPALFLDMFRLSSSANWKEYFFGDSAVMEIIDGDRGTNYPKKSDFSKTGYCLFLNTSNVRKGVFDFSKCDFVTQEKNGTLRKGKLVRGDVILTTRGTIGNTAHYHNQVPYENVRINSGMVVLRANPTVLMPEYLLAILNSGAFINQVTVLTSGSAQPQLPINRLARINFVLPPLHLQKELALRASEVRSIQSQQSAATAKAQATFDALLAQAFAA